MAVIKPLAHLDTLGHFVGIDHNVLLGVFVKHIAWPITDKCPRTQGATYYNCLSTSNQYSKNVIWHSRKRKYYQAPWDLHYVKRKYDVTFI